jgi:hypothetical protein
MPLMERSSLVPWLSLCFPMCRSFTADRRSQVREFLDQSEVESLS